MPTRLINGNRLYYEMHGAGSIPVVLVHGSWDSHSSWEPIVPCLARDFRVVIYDRRGHSYSNSPPNSGCITDDVDDLAELFDELKLCPAWAVGNSFGASIALRLLHLRPDLLYGVIGHEPPLFSLLQGDAAYRLMMDELMLKVGAVAETIAAGKHSEAAEQFVESVALGPGSWKHLPEKLKRTFIQNAPTFLDEVLDPDGLAFELVWAEAFARPVLLTRGETSPPVFAPVVGKLVKAPRVREEIVAGAGHNPHVTHPDVYCDLIANFVHKYTK